MTTTSAPIDQPPSGTLSADGRPLASLAVSPEELPRALPWVTDEAEDTQFVVLHLEGNDFALESDAEAPGKQITVYGVETGDALDGLLEFLGVDEASVLDRIDREDEAPEIAGAYEELQAEMAQTMADLTARMFALESRAKRSELERKEAAAALGLGAEELTERQRQTLSLILGGWTADEIAEFLHVSRGTVLRYKREAVARYAAELGLIRETDQGIGWYRRSERQEPVRSLDTLTIRERQVGMLAAQGLSNREIAERLQVTRKTVEWHLQHTFRKLGVKSRSALTDQLGETKTGKTARTTGGSSRTAG